MAWPNFMIARLVINRPAYPPAGIVLVVGFQISTKKRLSTVTLLEVRSFRVQRSAIWVT